jgi:PAS domain S-box-containing protein
MGFFYPHHDRIAIENRKPTINEESVDYVNDGYSRWIETCKTPIYDEQNELIGVLGIGRDINRRNQALKDSVDQQRFLDMSLDFSPIPMWIGSPTGTTLRGNKALYKMLNLRSEQIVGKYNLLTDENLQTPEIAEKINALLTRKEQIQFEVRWNPGQVKGVDLSSGNDIIMDVSIFPLLDPKGEITHIIGQCVDLTERTRAKEELARSEERFRTICENAPILINGFDANGHCMLWNQQCLKTFGWTLDEINKQAKPMALFYPDLDAYYEALKNVTSDPDGHFREWHPKTKDGKTLSTSWASFRLPNGQIFSIGHDITESKKAEKKLKESEALLRQSQEIARLGNWKLDIPTSQITWSDTLYHIFGIKPNEVQLTYEELLSRIHPEDRDYHDTVVDQLTTKGDVSFEYRIILPNGEIRWVSGRGTASLNEAGETVAISGIIQDITEQKQSEEDLRQSRDLLEERVEERTKDLQIMLDAMAGRENRMADLKLEIKELRAQLKEAGISPRNPEVRSAQSQEDTV